MELLKEALMAMSRGVLQAHNHPTQKLDTRARTHNFTLTRTHSLDTDMTHTHTHDTHTHMQSRQTNDVIQQKSSGMNFEN